MKITKLLLVMLFSIAVAACGGGGGESSTSNNTPASTGTLTSIAVTPPTATIAIGQAANFTVIGTYSDGTTRNITSTVNCGGGSAISTLRCNPIVATGTAIGSATIDAWVDISSTAVTVTSAAELAAYCSARTVLCSSATLTVTSAAGTVNAAPIANAGIAQNVVTGTLVTLNGSASSDANGDPLTYSWTLTSKPAGSTASLTGATSAAPTFTADAAGTYVASLTVNDGQVNSASASVTITATVGNVAPVANAGAAQNVTTGTLVTLNGSASLDANNDPLTYSWTLTSKPASSTATLTGATSAAPTFAADAAGTYVASLTVNDGQVNSVSASVTITAAVGNVAPVANAGAAQNVTTGTLVTLNGSASSDANGDPLTYSWTLTSKPASSTATLTGATSAAPTFTADLAGTYVASLVVNDGQVNSTASTVTITASVANAAPVANAGTAQNVTTGTLVTLNGSASSDANGDPLTYSWTLTSKPASSTATLTGATSAAPTFTADLAGTYVASLVVNDGQVNSAASTVTITASVANAAPVANAGTAQNVTTGTLVTLNGSASSDANGDPLTYSWTLTSKPVGSTASLTGATSVATTFTADAAGAYVATLAVNDGQLNSINATVTITASDTTPPTISSVSPVHYDTGVLWNTSITATFSEPMLASTINTATFTVGGATGTVTYFGTTATFTPSANLSASTTYTATITTGVKDAAGNQMTNNYTLVFTTCTPAYVNPNLYGTLVDYQRALAYANNACLGL